jgi:hypothetical protein
MLPILADARTVKQRLSLCKRCPLFIKGTHQCNPLAKHPNTGVRGCGCFVALKARVAGERCPGGLW